MKCGARVVSSLAVLFCLLWLPACDSDSNGGAGGSPATTGYTQADLAGRWRAIQTPNSEPQWVMAIEIDQNGEVTYAATKNGSVRQGFLSGSFMVSPDGKIRGEFHLRTSYPNLGAWVRITYSYRMHFTDAGTIRGTFVYRAILHDGSGGSAVVSQIQGGVYWTKTR